MLKRKFYDTLLHWKESHRQEGLLVKGARQIGDIFKRFIGQIPSSVQVVLSDDAILGKFFEAA